MNVFLTISEQPLGVPYVREADDPNSASYIDLKLMPEKVDDVPEARQLPVLRDMLVAINSPQSQLISTGCGVFIYPPEDEQGRQWRAYAYVGFGLSDLAMAGDASVYFPLFFHFHEHHRTRVDPGASVNFELRKTFFSDRQVGCFTVDFIVHALGPTETELRTRIDEHFRLLHKFLPLTGLMPA